MPDDSVTVASPAKINLTLDVKGCRHDGFHEIETLMQTVSLYDELKVEKRNVQEDMTLYSDFPGLPPMKDNLVYKAAQVLLDNHRPHSLPGIKMLLDKKIPVGAGLGGGSSNAAAALKALSSLLHLDVDLTDLERLAAGLGSDVPFFVRGGTANCRGRGEILEHLDVNPKIDFVITCPPVKISTPKVYKAYDSLTKNISNVKIGDVVESLRQNDPEMLGKYLFNSLKIAACKVSGELAEYENKLRLAFKVTGSLGYCMSGSGSAWFGVCKDQYHAKESADYIKQNYSLKAFAVRSISG